MYEDQLDIDLRVMDLYEGKVLYGKDIPLYGEGLIDSIAQFSGQTYMINISTGVKDRKQIKIYAEDIVDVYKLSYEESSSTLRTEKLGGGIIRSYRGAYGVHISKGFHDMEFIFLHDDRYEFEVIGNKLENKELLYLN